MSSGTTPGSKMAGTTVEIKESVGDGEPNSQSEPVTESEGANSLKDSKRAWMVCLAAFISQILHMGPLHVFGLFFVAFLDDFACTKAEAAWVGSAAYGLSMAFGPLASFVIGKFGNQKAAIVGCIICSASLLASSYVQTMDLLFVTFSFPYGVGVCLAYTPTMTLAGDYFDKYLAVATGFMVAGSSTGTLVFSPIVQHLILSFGWRVTFRVLSALVLLGIWCGWMYKPLNPIRRSPVQTIKKSIARRLMKDLQLWKNKVFVCFIIAVTFVQFGYYIPYVHLISHAIDQGISPESASLLLMILGASTATGRMMFGKIVDLGYLNRLHMHQLSMVVTGTGCMLLPLIKSFAGLMTYVVIIGLVDGCYVVLLPVLSATLAGMEHKVLAWGFLTGVSSITFTLGPPVAGWISDATGSYNISFHIAGIPIILGALTLFFIPWAQKTATTTNIMAAARSVPQRLAEAPQDIYTVTRSSSSESDTNMDLETYFVIDSDHSHSTDDTVIMQGSSESFVMLDDIPAAVKERRVRSLSESHDNAVRERRTRSVSESYDITERTGIPQEVLEAIKVLKKQSASTLEKVSFLSSDGVSLRFNMSPAASPKPSERSARSSRTDPLRVYMQDSESRSSNAGLSINHSHEHEGVRTSTPDDEYSIASSCLTYPSSHHNTPVSSPLTIQDTDEQDSQSPFHIQFVQAPLNGTPNAEFLNNFSLELPPSEDLFQRITSSPSLPTVTEEVVLVVPNSGQTPLAPSSDNATTTAENNIMPSLNENHNHGIMQESAAGTVDELGGSGASAGHPSRSSSPMSNLATSTSGRCLQPATASAPGADDEEDISNIEQTSLSTSNTSVPPLTVSSTTISLQTTTDNPKS